MTNITFDKPVKLYYFKDEQEVSVSFAVSPTVVFKVTFTEKEFDYIVENWNTDEGVQRLDTEHNGRIWWERRKFGPRPECTPCDFVSIEIKDFVFRIDTQDMFDMEDTYVFQKNNKMHWDD